MSHPSMMRAVDQWRRAGKSWRECAELAKSEYRYLGTVGRLRARHWKWVRGRS